ncbi:MAG: ribosome-binding factor A [Chloroflexi bacterium RBG_16_47_49]|nr:MAG: ribosome-binding factor A [Chloroflexi bacterium RBG_16_47_49]
MVSKTRITRISERIRQELSEILLMESSDPRLKGVMITDVVVDRELAFAEIYVCTIEGLPRSQEVVNSLDHAHGFLRSELAHRMQLRVFPRLRFHWDPTLEHSDKIEQLIKSIHQPDSGEQIVSKKRRVAKHDGSKS